MPRAGQSEEDDDAERYEDSEKQGGPCIQAPQHFAKQLHRTGWNEVAMPVIVSLESWLPKVLITQYSVLSRFHATM